MLLVGQLVVLFFKAFRCCYCYHLNPARKQRPIAPKLDYDTWTTPRHISGQGPGVRHRKPSNSVQAMLERKTGKHWEFKLASSLLIMFGLGVWFFGIGDSHVMLDNGIKYHSSEIILLSFWLKFFWVGFTQNTKCKSPNSMHEWCQCRFLGQGLCFKNDKGVWQRFCKKKLKHFN